MKRPTKPSRARAAAKTPEGRAANAPERARTRLDVEERRAQLVELGLSEFGSRTYDEVSIDLIAQAAGISKGLLYHYFPTKRAFYVACVRVAAARLIARVDEMPPGCSPAEQLTRSVDSYLAYVRAHGRAFATLLRSGVGADREIAQVIDETRTTLLSGLTTGLAEVFPATQHAKSPLLPIALQGWIGLAEAASIAWVEACVEAEASDAPTGPAAPTATEIRELLAKALVAIVQSITAQSSER